MRDELLGGESGAEGPGHGGRKTGGDGGGFQPEMRSSHAHAPAFLDPGAREEGGLAEDAEGALAVEACVDAVTGCRGLLAMLGQGGAAKKSERKAAKDAIKPRAEKVARALQASGWAVCDEFAPADLVHEVGKELASVSPHYESSEIWVGKDAGAARVLCIDVSHHAFMTHQWDHIIHTMPYARIHSHDAICMHSFTRS